MLETKQHGGSNIGIDIKELRDNIDKGNICQWPNAQTEIQSTIGIACVYITE